MRTRHALSLAAALAATALVAPGASAVQPTTYSGEFEGTIQYDNCTTGTPPTNAEAGGTWSVRVYDGTAKGKFDITVNGEKHVFYPFPGMTVDWQDSTGFSVHGDTGAGLLTVTLSGDELTYTVGTGEPGSYAFGDLVCDSVTYPGTFESD